MEQRTLERLEFNKIIEMLAQNATFSLGREMCLELRPSTDFNEVLRYQKETAEASTIYRKEPDLPLGGMRDTRGALRKVAIGAILEPAELQNIAANLLAARRIKKFFSDRSDQYPIMAALVKDIMVERDLEEAINEAIEDDGRVSDSASIELRKVRSKIRDLEINIKNKMDSIMRSSEYQKFFQEAIVTVRGDRYVIPVKHEFRGQFPGIIHDQSSSGATLFIEPVAIVELNNSLRRLFSEEEREIQRILTKLTGSVEVVLEDLKVSLDILGKVDFVLAKGKLAHRMNATEPVLNEQGWVNLKKARHPLITGEVVPIDIFFGREFKILVITGPNTGGKTVALKTIGLNTAMAQSGLHIPCEEGSQLAVFKNVFVDIGDEQSIEQSLSTFSAHLKNIIDIVQRVDRHSLVLLDELGAGTDPTEGAALAMSVLEFLYERGAGVVATTHYSELKVFAFEKEGVENASVEFDIKTLRPTYRLLIGQPGRSSAFEIALRLGLAEQIVDRARTFLTSDEIKVADLVEDLEGSRRKAEEEKLKAELLRQEVEVLKREYATKLAALEERRSGVLETAKEEAATIVRQARREADLLVKELRNYALEKQTNHLKEAEIARNRLRALEEERDTAILKGRMAQGDVPTGLQVGEKVFLPKYNQSGYVMVPPGEDGNLQVQVGIMKLTVNVSEVRRKKETPAKELGKRGASKIVIDKAKDAKTEINLLGKTVDEAFPEIEKFLDDAYLAGIPQVQIVHGKGTGVLRKAVQELLTKHRHVKEHRLGQYGEGGTGVTIVKLK